MALIFLCTKDHQLLHVHGFSSGVIVITCAVFAVEIARSERVLRLKSWRLIGSAHLQTFFPVSHPSSVDGADQLWVSLHHRQEPLGAGSGCIYIMFSEKKKIKLLPVIGVRNV